MKYLSKPDLNLTLDIIHSSLDCTTEAQFQALIDKLKSFIGITYVRSLFTNRPPDNHQITRMITTFPSTWEEYYANQNYFHEDNVAYVALRQSSLLSWEACQNHPALTREQNLKSRKIINEAASIGMKQGWIYSLHKRKDKEFSVLSFTTDTLQNGNYIRTILEYLSPHMGEAMKRTALDIHSKSYALSEREVEVLSWTAAGKTAWEISEILTISRRTVEFHMGNILKKLDAVNAQQAIAVALSSRLITY